jgi:DNA-binding HxlR family transcriptional regulator
MLEYNDKKSSSSQSSLTVHHMFEDILGCKWSLCVLQRVCEGVRRPGELERSIDGISTKVLNERLNKLTRFGVIEKRAYPEIPPRVEYYLTDFGEKFIQILSQIEQLAHERKA